MLTDCHTFAVAVYTHTHTGVTDELEDLETEFRTQSGCKRQRVRTRDSYTTTGERV